MTECDPDEVEDCNVTLLTKEVPSTNEKNSSLVQKRNTLEIRKMFNYGRQMESRNGCSNTKKGKKQAGKIKRCMMRRCKLCLLYFYL